MRLSFTNKNNNLIMKRGNNMTMNYSKYKAYEGFDFPNRTWPNNRVVEAPVWCSVDLRDGNQALPIPMNVEKKLKTFEILKRIGFKEIEVSFPSASDTDFAFVRELIENNLIDNDMTIQVLTQSRDHLIEKTFESLKGCKKSIIHLYNSTSELQRRVVFNKSKKEIIDIAVKGAIRLRELEKYADGEILYEYSPESFTGTEMDFALEICEEVIDIFEPTPDRKLIINLPSTVEMATPNVYADQIEWFSKNIKKRDSVIISVHAHNDRGTAVAATELAMLAGADRVEGTLFGNGERTGNADLITLAMNLFSQGIDPGLDIKNINEIINIYEECTGLNVHERHPYAGELVFTAFSGSHQDAIRKGLQVLKKTSSNIWEVPYLPIDPADIGREYEEIIRINSQSGKGGVAFILESEFGYHLPKAMHAEFGKVIKEKTDAFGKELKAEEIFEIFKQTYLDIEGQIILGKCNVNSQNGNSSVKANIIINNEQKEIEGVGNGPISAFVNGLRKIGIDKFSFETYQEHALTKGESAEAAAYIELKTGEEAFFGVGIDANVTTASFKAIICALNRYYCFN